MMPPNFARMLQQRMQQQMGGAMPPPSMGMPQTMVPGAAPAPAMPATPAAPMAGVPQMNQAVNAQLASPGMTGQMPASNPMAGAMGPMMMGMNMMNSGNAGAAQVIGQRQQMNQQGLDRMQQIARMMQQRMSGGM